MLSRITYPKPIAHRKQIQHNDIELSEARISVKGLLIGCFHYSAACELQFRSILWFALPTSPFTSIEFGFCLDVVPFFHTDHVFKILSTCSSQCLLWIVPSIKCAAVQLVYATLSVVFNARVFDCICQWWWTHMNVYSSVQLAILAMDGWMDRIWILYDVSYNFCTSISFAISG